MEGVFPEGLSYAGNIAASDEDLRAETRLGYRAPYVRELRSRSPGVVSWKRSGTLVNDCELRNACWRQGSGRVFASQPAD